MGPWQDGEVEAILATAAATCKPLLIYWGAVWCPPCNELKSQVLTRMSWSEVPGPVLALALDGDSPGAQAWAERFRLSGYPTLLLLGPDGQERMRFTTGGVAAGDFTETLARAVACGRSAETALARALAQDADADDWHLLARYAWDGDEDLGGRGAARLRTLAELAEKVPPALRREQTLLAAHCLEAAAAAAHADAATAASLRRLAPVFLERLLASHAAAVTARSTLVYNAAAILTWAEPGAGETEDDRRVLAAVERLADDTTLSIDIRLWARAAPFSIWRARRPGAPASESLRRRVQEAAAWADPAAKTTFERKSCISGAALLLRQAGDIDGARRLLVAELKTTDTPWYYLSSLVNVEKAAGDTQAALAWSKQARTAALGRASRLQWLVEDLVLNATLAETGREEQVAALTRAYCELALSLGDGFQGRNAARGRRVAEHLKPLLAAPAVRSVIRDYADRCPPLASLRDNA